MPAQKKGSRAVRRAEKLTNSAKKNRVALQPDGMPQGRHITGFKGMKVDTVCFCGGCHPNAQAAKGKVIVIR